MVAAARRLTTAQISIILLLLVFTVGLVFHYGGRQTDDEWSAFPHGELRIAVDASYAPFAVYTEDNELQGLDIDVGLALGEHLNLSVRFVPMGIDSLYDSLIDDQADIIISALVVDNWRLHEARYTRPYFDAGLVLVRPAGSAIDAMADLPGYSLAYEFGSVADSEVRMWSRRIGGFETQPYELPEYALDAVRLDVADAALVDAVDTRLYFRSHPEWKRESDYVTHRYYVIAVRADRKKTFAAVDDALRDLLLDDTIATIIDRWL